MGFVAVLRSGRSRILKSCRQMVRLRQRCASREVLPSAPWSVSTWVESPRGRTVMSHVEMADKLLIKPTGWARPTPTSGRQLGRTAGCNEPPPITLWVVAFSPSRSHGNAVPSVVVPSVVQADDDRGAAAAGRFSGGLAAVAGDARADLARQSRSRRPGNRLWPISASPRRRSSLRGRRARRPRPYARRCGRRETIRSVRSPCGGRRAGPG